MREEGINQIKESIRKNEPFTLDTNKLIELAEYGGEGYSVLKSLASCKYFVLSDKVVQEVDAIFYRGSFGKKTTTYLGNFIKEYKRRARAQGIAGTSNQGMVAKLAPYVELLPRKLVMDVMINLPDSFYNKIRVNPKDDILFENEKDALNKKIMERFNLLLREHRIDKLIINKEKSEYYKKALELKHDVLVMVENLRRGDLKTFETYLQAYGRKSFENDVKIVADAIAKNITVKSGDCDVVWLENFYSISRRAS